jgi:FKBP-type peptidyl-prolyl cis-trans isomerase
MEEKELKTSVGQRVAIIIIAIAMLGSIIAGYVAIVAGGGKTTNLDDTAGIGNDKIEAYKTAYEEKLDAFKKVSKSDFEKFVSYRSEVKAYNETAANEGILQTKDLYVGSGRELTEGDKDYLAYYIGWCADETIFDSSFDDNDNPTAFTSALDVSKGMIEGWDAGVVGMRIGGVRRITMSGDLAYGSTTEICGGYNKPLRFLVMAVANEDPLKTAASDVELAYMKLMYAYYGIDYDAEMAK